MRISARPINYIACLLVIFAAVLSGCSDAEARIDRHVQRGQDYLSRGRYPEARIEFRSALQIDRRNAPAQYGLGRAALAMGYLQESAEAFYQTMRLDPSNLQARLEVGNLLARYPDDESLREAERLAGEVLAKDPASVEARLLTASVRIAQKKWDEAETIIRRANADAHSRIEPRLHLARYFSVRAADQPGQSKRWLSEAETVYLRLVESNPKSAEARLALGEFLFSTGRPEEAEKELLSAVEADPFNKVALLALVRFCEDRRKFDQAERYLTRLVELDEDKVEGRSQIIELRARAGRTSEAIAGYRLLLRDNPDYLRGYSRLAELLIESGDVSGAAVEADRALRLSPQDTDALLVRGRLHTIAGRHAEALRDLDQVLRLEPSMPSALYFAAEAALRGYDPSRARMLANRLLSFSPRNPMGLLMSARILLAENRPREAESAATRALNSIRTLNSTPSDSRWMPADSAWESKTLVTRALARMRNDAAAEARADLMAASELDPRTPEPLVNLAAISLSEKRYADAARLAGRALEIDPSAPAALRLMVDARLATKDYDGALRQLAELKASGPLTDEQRARILLARGDPAGAEKLLRKIIETHPDHLNAYFMLSEVLQSSSKQTESAISELRRLIERRPENAAQLAQAHLIIGLLEDGRGNHRQAVESYENVLAFEKRSSTAAIALNNLAWLFADKGLGNLDQAVDYARRAIAILPEPAFFDTLGYAYLKKGQHRIAAEQFSRAIAGNPSNPAYSQHLREAEKLSGRK